MTKEISLGYDFPDSHEDLLYQLVEAERLLEKICIQEGKKEDPRNSPHLHAKCEEKARKKQEDSDVRIQKNIELIRKVRTTFHFLNWMLSLIVWKILAYFGTTRKLKNLYCFLTHGDSYESLYFHPKTITKGIIYVW